MDTDRIESKTYIERLNQAVRVMENLSENDRANFDLGVWAVVRDGSIAACVAGHCGLDPWFQAQGLRTYIGTNVGQVYPHPIEFFGTDLGFYRHTYGPEFNDRAITPKDAIAALRQAISEFAEIAIDCANIEA
jgi:hypothetical protein